MLPLIHPMFMGGLSDVSDLFLSCAGRLLVVCWSSAGHLIVL